MLYLDTGIHFHKIEFTVFVYQEFNGSGTFIAYSLCAGHRCLAHLFAEFVGNYRGGGFLDQLLMSSLDGAVAL
ncbi:hypothetical protein D9M68_907520 [compost metagenome]